MKNLMDEFGYIIDKINTASFVEIPFKHLLLTDFLSDEHFQEIIHCKEVNKPVYKTTESLIQDLLDSGYQVQNFPGCTTSIEQYLKSYNSNKYEMDTEILEGFGLTMRLKKFETPLVERILTFLNSEEFSSCLKNKFGVVCNNKLNTSIQKYLHGYEISPHPDERNKALTYLLNINPNPKSEKDKIHTSLLKFIPERKYIYDFWKYNDKIERCWVPWNWCEKVVETNLNNCFVIFSPSNESLHGVKLDYSHLEYQRTQIYGNLFYEKSSSEIWKTYKDIDLLKNEKSRREKVKSLIPSSIINILKK